MSSKMAIHVTDKTIKKIFFYANLFILYMVKTIEKN